MQGAQDSGNFFMPPSSLQTIFCIVESDHGVLADPACSLGYMYLNLHPERLEVVNPGRLPLGVTPRNMLHASRRRNEAMARVFHDLGMMEREGSGIDLVYDRLLSLGRPAPVPQEGTDWVKVTSSALNARAVMPSPCASTPSVMRSRCES